MAGDRALRCLALCAFAESSRDPRARARGYRQLHSSLITHHLALLACLHAPGVVESYTHHPSLITHHSSPSTSHLPPRARGCRGVRGSHFAPSFLLFIFSFLLEGESSDIGTLPQRLFTRRAGLSFRAILPSFSFHFLLIFSLWAGSQGVEAPQN